MSVLYEYNARISAEPLYGETKKTMVKEHSRLRGFRLGPDKVAEKDIYDVDI